MSAGTGKRRITVLSGGWSAEREVSLVSGRGVADALAARGHEVAVFDPPADPAGIAAGLSPRPDLVFNALHGTGGEDGTIQAILDLLGVPYTHSGLLASAVAMNKPLAKRLVATAGIRCPEGVVLRRAALCAGHPLPPPYVVKPVAEGSSVGVVIVRPGANAPLTETGQSGDDLVMVEPYVRGRELTVGVMSRPGEPARALGVTEIVYQAEMFDYTVKYSAGHATHILPAQIPESVYGGAMDYARLAHEVMGCAGVTRSDFRWDDAKPGTEGLFFLEINTQPGMTPISLVPEQAALIGKSYGDLVEWIAEAALCRR
jgi:D-alanine-D-alanine ligase